MGVSFGAVMIILGEKLTHSSIGIAEMERSVQTPWSVHN